MGEVLKLNEYAVRDVRFSGLMNANKDKLCEWLEVSVYLTELYTTTSFYVRCNRCCSEAKDGADQRSKHDH